MLSVDISNIWCSVSLPELLAEEKSVFDAHMALGGGEHRQNPWLSWLDSSDSAKNTWVKPIMEAAERIRLNSQILVVVGGGLPCLGAQAAIRLQPGHASDVQLLFTGDDFSGDKWLRIVQTLENADFSVLVSPSTCGDTAPLITLRALRWIMEKRYGDTAKNRVYIASPGQNSSLTRVAENLGYTLLHMPEAPGAGISALNPAALLIMAVGGMSPGLVFSGAAEMAVNCDIRSFDNPVWLYTGARAALRRQGLRCETICTPSPESESLGAWWQRAMSAAGNKDGCGFFVNHAKLPGDFFTMGDSLLEPGQFATFLRLPISSRRVTVEMDWKDLDGLNGLAGQDLSFVETKTLDAIADGFIQQDVPFLTVECSEPMTDDKIGELVYFTELSAGLSAQIQGVSPTARRHADKILARLDDELGRNSSRA